MSGRPYSLTFTRVAVSTAVDIFETTINSGRPLDLTGLHIGQDSDAGDAQDEMLTIEIIKGFTTSGSGGAAVTARPLDGRDALWTGAAERLNTTLALGGTPLVMLADAWNIRAGYVWTPTPDQYIKQREADRIVVRSIKAPTDPVTMSGTLFFLEF